MQSCSQHVIWPIGRNHTIGPPTTKTYVYLILNKNQQTNLLTRPPQILLSRKICLCTEHLIQVLGIILSWLLQMAGPIWTVHTNIFLYRDRSVLGCTVHAFHLAFYLFFFFLSNPIESSCCIYTPLCSSAWIIILVLEGVCRCNYEICVQAGLWTMLYTHARQANTS